MASTTARMTMAAAIAITAVVGTCAAGSAQTVTIKPNQQGDPKDVSMLPADVKSRGTLAAATTDGNAPWSFVDPATGQVSGVDRDLIDEAAKRLGLKVDWSVIQFTAGIPGVQSGRYDLYVSAMADTRKREEVVDFIAYSQEGSGVIVAKGNPDNVKTMKDLCGKRVAIVTGSMFPPILADLDKACGERRITVSETADQTGPYLAVASGQADATMNTYGVSSYTLKTATGGIQTRLELSPVERFAPANQGIAFSKAKPETTLAIAGALQAMNRDGTYKQIMEKWQVGDGALPEILVNAPAL